MAVIVSRSSSYDSIDSQDEKSQGSSKRWIYALICTSFIFGNLYSPSILSTILEAYQTSDSRTAKKETPTSPSPKGQLTLSNREKRILERITTKISTSAIPQTAPNTTGGFIHVGKTGGSTLTSGLRNGCHAWFPRPCRVVANESIISKSATYYHTPDWKLLATEPHDYYIFTVRDPFARTVSAFLYQHPYNVYIRRRQYKEKVYNFPMRKLHPIFTRCFKTLNEFAQALKFQYPRQHSISLVDAKHLKCQVLANAMLQHKAENLSQHLHYDFRLFREPLEGIFSNAPDDEHAFFAIRTEFLWHDWVTINELLGQAPGTVVSNEKSQLRNMTNYILPVNSTIGETEREYLCKSIESEYQAYFDLLSVAINLDQKDVRKMKEMARKNCPTLEILQ